MAACVGSSRVCRVRTDGRNSIVGIKWLVCRQGVAWCTGGGVREVVGGGRWGLCTGVGRCSEGG